MIDFQNIKEHKIERPDGWTCLGGPTDFDSLPNEFKDQIAGDFLYKYFKASKFHTGPMWEPFKKKNFKYVEKIAADEDAQTIKKWLYNRGIPFAKWVYVLPNYSNVPLMMTWKMVIKNYETLFFADDVVIFDETNQWCLSYWHEDELFFGKINSTDPEIGYNEIEQMNGLERKPLG